MKKQILITLLIAISLLFFYLMRMRTTAQLTILANQLNGTWTSNDWLRKIEESQSVIDNQNIDALLLSFTLEEDNLVSDSAMLKGYTAHEGGYNSPLRYNRRESVFELTSDLINKSCFSEPFEIRTHSDTTISLEFNSDKSNEYRKTALQDALRAILFEGSYRSENGDIITFNSNGSTTGIENYSYFTVFFDFSECFTFDGIGLWESEEEAGNWDEALMFKYQISNDTIVLTKADCQITDDGFQTTFDEILTLLKTD